MHVDTMTLDRGFKPKKISYIIVYLLFLLKAGYLFIEQYNRLTAPIYCILLLYLCFIWKKKVEKSVIIVVMMMVVNITLTGLFHGFPDMNVFILTIFNLITSMLLVCIFDKDEFQLLYCDIILAICIASIVGWILIKFNNPIINRLPTLVNSKGREAHFAVLTMISDFSFTGAQRAQGIFWEPGAFQALIVPAMLIYNYGNRSKKVWWVQIVYAIAILLTFSTTGYICLTLTLMLFLNQDTKYFKLFRVLLFLLALSLFYILFSSNLVGFLKYTLVDKIEMILNYQIGISNEASSRMDSVVLPLINFFDNPIFGLGKNGYEELYRFAGHTMFTCTPVTYLTKYGLFFAGICFLGFLRVMHSPKMTRLDYVIVVLIVMLAFSSEDFMMNPILSVFMFYGYKHKYSYRNKLM